MSECSHDDRIYAADQRLTDVYYQLRKLANGFADTGNPVVADKLWLMADDIETAKKEVRQATGDMLDARLRDARQGTANLLNLSLALLTPRGEEPTS